MPPQPIEFDETADCIASYYAAVAELRRRYLAGEYPYARPGCNRNPRSEGERCTCARGQCVDASQGERDE